MKKTTVNQSLLPAVWLNWKLKSGNVWLECKTGAKQSTAPNVQWRDENWNTITIQARPNSVLEYGYLKYHEDIDKLEMAVVKMETHRQEEARKWEYYDEDKIFFLGKDKKIYDRNGNECTRIGDWGTHNSWWTDPKGFLNRFTKYPMCNSAMEEFHKFIGGKSFSISNGRLIECYSPWHIEEWFIRKQAAKTSGKQQKLVDKLVEMQLTDASDFSEKYPTIECPTNSRWHRTVRNILYFERLEDGWSVLRAFTRNKAEDELKETQRMYLHDDGTNRITSPSPVGWVPTQQYREYGDGYQFVNKAEAMEKCNRLKYILPLFDDVDQYTLKKYIMTVLRFPEIEQLMKMGYKSIGRTLASSPTPKADMKNMFGGVYNEKETTIIRKSGLNKHQFAIYMADRENNANRYSHTSLDALKEVRRFFEDDFNSLDKATFEEYYNEFKKIRNATWRTFPVPPNTDAKRFLKNSMRIGKKYENAYHLINDTYQTWVQLHLDRQPQIDWMFDDYSDLVRAHDAINELKRMQDAERRARWDANEAERLKKNEAKRIELDKKRKEYEYEDDNFIIRLPLDAKEIIREGSMQHICIGGYVDRHSLGGTNLFFLRKKSEPDHPFYAIEMNNAKEIVQIHGFGNKWLGNNPEAIPTVVRWLRKNEIRCSREILTCTSVGYSRNAQYVPMPQVD